jgi:hypothetical protein
MTPKEKAQELYFKFYSKIPSIQDEGEMQDEASKQCALILVDEILKNSVNYNAYDGVDGNDIWSDNEYWIEVKKDIENI